MEHPDFWSALDELIRRSQLGIDRPRGSAHPRFPALTYPLDYGYLAQTSSTDGEGVDVWQGSALAQSLNAIICTVDLEKRDIEVKLLLGCTREEIQLVLDFHNRSPSMKGLLVPRPGSTP